MRTNIEHVTPHAPLANKFAHAGFAGCTGYDSTFCGGLDMSLAWEVIYMITLVFVALLIPFAIFYYEADDGIGNAKESMFCSAVKYEFLVLLVTALTLTLMYIYLGTTEIPTTVYTASFDQKTTHLLAAGSWTDPEQVPPFDAITNDDLANALASFSSMVDITINMKVTFPIYAMAMMGFVGWFLFVLFAGVGLAALPVDLICAYIYRPRHMNAIEFAEAQLSVRTRVNELIEIGEMLKQERMEKESASRSVPPFTLTERPRNSIASATLRFCSYFRTNSSQRLLRAPQGEQGRSRDGQQVQAGRLPARDGRLRA